MKTTILCGAGFLWTGLLLLTAVPQPGQAQEVDPSFGSGGVIRSKIGGNQQIARLVPAADGRTFVFGSLMQRSYAYSGERAFVAAVAGDGKLDAGFGREGYASLPVTVANELDPSFLQLRIAGRCADGLRLNDGSLLAAANFASNGIYSEIPDTCSLIKWTSGGSLDSTFSGDGIVNVSTQGATIVRIAERTDGIVGIGSITNGNAQPAALFFRSAATGAPLPQIGGGSGQVLPVPPAPWTSWSFSGLQVLSDDKLLVTGEIEKSTQPSEARWFIARFTAAGALDTTFGTGGLFMPPAGADTPIWLGTAALTVLQDGRIRACRCGNYFDPRVVFAGVLASGQADPAFNGGQGWRVVTPAQDPVLTACSARPGGWLLGGSGTVENEDSPVVLAFDFDGVPSASFGAGGRKEFPERNVMGDAVAAAVDGTVMTAGEDVRHGQGSKFLSGEMWLSRLTAGGQPVTSFGVNGASVLTLEGLPVDVVSVLLRPDGRRIVVGNQLTPLWLAGGAITVTRGIVEQRLANGALDPSFGDGGVAFLPVPEFDGNGFLAIQKVALMADGKLCLAGIHNYYAPGSNHYSYSEDVVRLNDNGSIDSGFVYEPNPGWPNWNSAQVDALYAASNGKLLLRYHFETSFSIPATWLRLNTNGTVDAAFGQDGAVSDGEGASPPLLFEAGKVFRIFDETPPNEFGMDSLTEAGLLEDSFLVPRPAWMTGPYYFGAPTSLLRARAGGFFFTSKETASPYPEYLGRMLPPANGTAAVDRTFGTGAGYVSGIRGLLLGQDAAGKILLAHADGVDRYLEDGRLDTSFGDGDGKFDLPHPAGTYAKAQGHALLADGRVWLAGRGNLETAGTQSFWQMQVLSFSPGYGDIKQWLTAGAGFHFSPPPGSAGFKRIIFSRKDGNRERVIDPSSGAAYDGANPAANFDDAMLVTARNESRSRITSPNGNPAFYRSLMLATYLRIVANNYAGLNSLQYAEKRRLISPSGTAWVTTERQALEDALFFFREAAKAFNEASGNAVDAAILDGSHPGLAGNPFGSTDDLADLAVTGPADVLSAYARALDNQAGAMLRLAELRYGEVFADTKTSVAKGGRETNAAAAALAAEIRGWKSDLELQLLLAEPFRRLSSYSLSAFSEVRSRLGLLGQISAAVSEGDVIFLVSRGLGAQDFGANAARRKDVVFRYNLDYVPFMAVSQNDSSSFDALAGLAAENISAAIPYEDAARQHTLTLQQGLADMQRQYQEIVRRYSKELTDLCGEIRVVGNDASISFQPDIITSSLPPDQQDRALQILAAQQITSTSKGRLRQQWGRVQAAEDGVKAALLELQQYKDQIKKSQETAALVAGLQFNLAKMYQRNGETFAALAYESGQIDYEVAFRLAAIDVARQQRLSNAEYENAESRGFWGGVGSWLTGVVGVALAPFTAGGSLAVAGAALSAWAGSAIGMYQAYENANDEQKLILKRFEANSQATAQTAEVNAERAVRQAEITAKQQRLSAMASAYASFAAGQTELIKNAEAVFLIFQRIERQRLEIVTRENQLALELEELSNLNARSAFLLREYSRELVEVFHPNYSSVAATSADYRILRDAAIEDARDRFLEAQRWVYLSARTASYEANYDATYAPQFKTITADIMKARTAGQLSAALLTLKNTRAAMFSARRGLQHRTAELSLRNQIAQNNAMVLNANEEPDRTASRFEVQGAGAAAGVLSDADWAQFLRDHIHTVVDPGLTFDELVIDFAVNLDPPPSQPQLVNGRATNDLFSDTQFVELIRYDPAKSVYGVQVRIVASRSVAAPSTTTDFTVDLSALGTSTIRNGPYCRRDVAGNLIACDGDVVMWNLEPATALLRTGWNEWKTVQNAALENLSPGNTRWRLRIKNLGPMSSLFGNVDKITDIKLQFGLAGFTGQPGQ